MLLQITSPIMMIEYEHTTMSILELHLRMIEKHEEGISAALFRAALGRLSMINLLVVQRGAAASGNKLCALCVKIAWCNMMKPIASRGWGLGCSMATARASHPGCKKTVWHCNTSALKHLDLKLH